MSFTVFLGNLPAWVTADDIKAWLGAEGLVADHIKVIRNPETQESKGFAFIDAPNQDEMQSIIKRFDRAPLEDRLLRANPAQPPRGKGPVGPGMGAQGAPAGAPGPMMGERPAYERGPRPGDRRNAAARRPAGGPPPTGGQQPTANANPSASSNQKPNSGRSGSQSAFAEELAKAL